MNKANEHETFATLRQRAEALLRSGHRNQPELSGKDMAQVFHELNVYQTELELQNEELRQNQQKLYDAQEQYRNLYDFAPVGYLTLNPEGVIEQANLTASTMLGVERTVLQQRLLTNWIVAEDCDSFYLFQRQSITTHKPQTCDLCMVRTDGSIFYARLKSIVVEDAYDKPSHRIAIIDSTDRVQAERALRQAHEELEQRVDERTTELREANYALRCSEELFRMVLQDSSTIVFTHDSSLRYTAIYNPVWPFAAQEFLGKTDADLLPASEAERLMSLKRRVLNKGMSVREDVSLLVDGRMFWYDIKAEPVRGMNGHVIGITCVATDVTAYQRAIATQRLLSELSKQLSLALSVPTCLQILAHLLVSELADACSIDVLTDDGYIQNLLVLHHNEAPERQQISTHSQSRIDWDNQHPVIQVLQTEQSLLIPELTEAQRHASTRQRELVSFAQEPEIISYLGVPLVTRARQTGVLSLLRTRQSPRFDDVDQQMAEEVARRAALVLDNVYLYEEDQQAWRAAELAADRMARLQRVTAALIEGISFDEIARVIVEQAVASLGAYAGSVALLDSDKNNFEIVYAQGYEETWLPIWQAVDSQIPSPMATAVLEGTAVWIESRASFEERYPSIDQVDSRSHAWAALPLVIEKRLLGGLGLSFTEERIFSAEERWFMLALAQQCAQALERARLYEQERQARAQAEDAVQARDQMFRLISHDLRAPLTTIQGYAHLLKRRISSMQGLDTEQFGRGLDNIEAATSRMAGQIQELLDAALLHGGQSLALNLESVDLVELVQYTVESCQSLSERHTLHLDTHENRLICSGDSMRLERVLTNLLTNAIKYSPQGGEVVVRLIRQQQDEHTQAVLEVRDQGIGIPAADIPKLFTPFQRGSNVSEKMKGTGLGLASVRQIIEQHGGQIDVSSAEGQGSTFIIWLPLLHETHS